jgi:PAS domain S-box-containing protein
VARAWVPHFVLWLSLAATAGASAYVHYTALEQDRLRFNRAVEQTRLAISERIEIHSITIRHVAALFQAGGIPSRKQLSDFVATVGVRDRHPGIKGIGFCLRVTAADRAKVEKVARENDVEPSFFIWPTEPARDEYYPVFYLEPLDERNRFAVGYDMYSESARAAAMDTAAATGTLAASGKIRLVQEDERIDPVQPGFVLFMPLYKAPTVPATEEERQEKLIGFIFGGFRAWDFFRAVFAGDPNASVDFRFYDGTAESPAQLMYDSSASRPASGALSASPPSFSQTQTVMIAGRPWTIRVDSRPELETASNRWLAPVIFVVGALASFTFFVLTRSQVRALSRGRTAMRDLERSQEDLRRSEARFRRLADANLVGVAFCDLDGNVTEGNDEFFRIIGRPRSQALAGRLRREQLTPREFHDRDRLAMEQLRATGVCTPYEKELLRPDGTRVPVLVGMAMLEGSGGRECVVLDIDITQRKQFERELRDARDSAEGANRAKDRFLAVLSHELRTPLAPVLLAVSIWERDGSLPPEMHADFRMIRRNVELEARLIDDLLDLTRVGRGKLHLDADLVDAHAAVRHALEIGPEREARAKGVTVECRLEAADANVRGDAARLQQVFWNLLHNAVKFTPTGGRITVRSCNPAAGRLRVEVEDTGIGIEPALLPRIFEAFEQGEAARSRASGGLGLGLAITRGLVAAHAGTIDVSSDGIGCGARFVVEFPNAIATDGAFSVQPTFASQQTRAEPPPAPAGGRIRILVVEDHPDSARLLDRLLRAAGFAPEVAETVASATQAGADRKFDVLLTDLALPDGTGIDALRALRQTRVNAEIPAIALTGHGMPDDLMSTESAGFCFHLTKPVDLQQLEAAIHRAVNRDRSGRRTG